MTIQRLKRQYLDTRANRNLDKLNTELQDVQRIMTQNIQDVLGRGERLESMCSLLRVATSSNSLRCCQWL